MEKMTIKFWDKKYLEYDDDTGYMVDESLNVIEDDDFWGCSIVDGYEPHFYINGERVA